MNEAARKLMIVAGEPSGDMHAAALIRALRADTRANIRGAHFDCFGMGLEETRSAGLRRLVDARDLSLVGLFEVIAHYPKLRRAYRRLLRALREETPDLLVLVDYPDFNLKLAGDARRLGVKTLFYISPQVWAWRAGRVKTIARRVDMMAVVFPFEEQIYRDAGVPVRYVGHPLLEQIPERPAPPHERGKVLLMPGSRLVEVRRLLPVLCRAAVALAARVPSVRFSLLLAPNVPEELVRRELSEHGVEYELIRGDPYPAMRAGDLAITASGTATLQLALCETPMVIVYKVSWPTYLVLKRLVRTPHIGLVNVIAGKRIAPELIQGDATPEAICREAAALLEDPALAQRTRRDLQDVRRALDGGGSVKLAALVREMTERG